MKNFTDEKTLLREIKNGNGEAFEFLFNLKSATYRV